jgi:hypothetical protein
MEACVHRRLVEKTVAIVLIAGASVAAGAQQPASKPLSKDEIASLAKVQVAINVVHDSMDAELSHVRNKKNEIQAQLRQKYAGMVTDVIQKAGMTEAQYREKTFAVSFDASSRKIFDSVVVAVTGAPLPGAYAAPAAGPTLPVPAGPVGTHIGHVVNAFNGTPNGGGLLPTAMGEARVALQHAQLAGRQPTNLDYMKTHAGHIINAIDPTIEKTGPGLGYGLKKASDAVATHIELAAEADGATPSQKLHAGHVATCARNTSKRADELLALAQKVKAATTAPEAAALVAQMNTIATQLLAGFDANGDGRVSVDPGEGGLQLADDHVKLMLGGNR